MARPATRNSAGWPTPYETLPMSHLPRSIALEMQLVQHLKLCRVALRRLYQHALARALLSAKAHTFTHVLRRTLAHRSSCGHLGSNNITTAREKGHASRKARSRRDMLEKIGRTAVPL